VKIGIDLTAMLATPTGVDNYLKQLVIHLGRLDRRNQYTVFVAHGSSELKKRLPENVRIVSYPVGPRPLRLLFQQLWLPVASASSRIEVIHSPSFLRPLCRGRRRHVLSVHDMTFFLLPECHTRLHRSRVFRHAIVRSIHGADLVSVPSNSVKQDLMKILPDIAAKCVRKIPYGIDEDFVPADSAAARNAIARLKLPERYILHVGSIEPRKNISARELSATGHLEKCCRTPGLDRPLGWSYQPVLKQLESSDLQGCSILILSADHRVDLGDIAARKLHHGCIPISDFAGSDEYRYAGCFGLREGIREVSDLIPGYLSPVGIR
jgi:hypothetical protein